MVDLKMSVWRWTWPLRARLQRGLEPGTRFPELALNDVQGRRHSLSRSPAGELTVLWFTNFCADCLSKRPLLENLLLRQGNSFRVLAVSILPAEDPFPIKASSACGFPVLLDPEDLVSRRLGLSHPAGTCPIHNLFILDPRGSVLYRRHLSAMSQGEFEAVWKQLLERRTGRATPAPGYRYALGPRVFDGAYDALFGLAMPEADLRGAVTEALRGRPPGKLLDLGCGTGSQLLHIGRNLPGWALTGIDGDQRVLDRAARKAAAAGVKVELRQGLAGGLGYPGESFDTVVSTMVFHHLDRETKAASLSEIRRILKRRGVFLLLDFDAPASAWTRLVSPLWLRLEGKATAGDSFLGAVPEMARAAGFELRPRFVRNTLFGTVRLWEAS